MMTLSLPAILFFPLVAQTQRLQTCILPVLAEGLGTPSGVPRRLTDIVMGRLKESGEERPIDSALGYTQ